MTSAECVGRYVLYPPIARGGMATVHAARLNGGEGFSRLVAAKRLHPHFTEDPEFVAMFHDEARIASRIHHPNVVPVLDVVHTEHEIVLVQEYVHGVPLSILMRDARSAGIPIPTRVAVAVITGVLAGLHAAHEAKDELGQPLDVIHRDVSPQNVMVSVEGVARLLDFGIAKARTSAHHTRQGVFKGKLSYMAPEQVRMEPLGRKVDLYAVGVVMWELLANRRFNDGMDEGEFIAALMEGTIPSIAEVLARTRRGVRRDFPELEAVVARARAVSPSTRYETALEMQEAVDAAAFEIATQTEVAAWLKATAAGYITKQQAALAEAEESWRASQSRARCASELPTEPLPIYVHVEEETADRQPTSLSPFESAAPYVAERPVLPWVVAGVMSTIALMSLAMLLVLGTQAPAPVVVAAPPPPQATPLPPPAPSASVPAVVRKK